MEVFTDLTKEALDTYDETVEMLSGGVSGGTIQVHLNCDFGHKPVTVKGLSSSSTIRELFARAELLFAQALSGTTIKFSHITKPLSIASPGTLADNNIGMDAQGKVFSDNSRLLGGWGEMEAARSTLPSDRGLIPGDTGLVQGNQVRNVLGQKVSPDDILVQRATYKMGRDDELEKLASIARDAGLVMRSIDQLRADLWTVELNTHLLNLKKALAMTSEERLAAGLDLVAMRAALAGRLKGGDGVIDGLLGSRTILQLEQTLAAIDADELEKDRHMKLQLKALIPRALGVGNCDHYAVVTAAHLVAQQPPIPGVVQYVYTGIIIDGGHAITVTTPELVEKLPATSADFDPDMADVVDGWMNNQVITVRDYEAGDNNAIKDDARVQLNTRYSADGSQPAIPQEALEAFVAAARTRADELVPGAKSHDYMVHGEHGVYDFTGSAAHGPDPEAHDRRTKAHRETKLAAVLAFARKQNNMALFEAEVITLTPDCKILTEAQLLAYFLCSDRARKVVAGAPAILQRVVAAGEFASTCATLTDAELVTLFATAAAASLLGNVTTRAQAITAHRAEGGMAALYTALTAHARNDEVLAAVTALTGEEKKAFFSSGAEARVKLLSTPALTALVYAMIEATPGELETLCGHLSTPQLKAYAESSGPRGEQVAGKPALAERLA